MLICCDYIPLFTCRIQLCMMGCEMKKVLSVRVDDALFTKVEKLDESKSEVVSKALTSYLLQPDEQQSKQLAQISEADNKERLAIIREILAIIRDLSQNQSALFTRMDDIEEKFSSLEEKFFNVTMEYV